MSVAQERNHSLSFSDTKKCSTRMEWMEQECRVGVLALHSQKFCAMPVRFVSLGAKSRPNSSASPSSSVKFQNRVFCSQTCVWCCIVPSGAWTNAAVLAFTSPFQPEQFVGQP
jgi:hypothetical protein